MQACASRIAALFAVLVVAARERSDSPSSGVDASTRRRPLRRGEVQRRQRDATTTPSLLGCMLRPRTKPPTPVAGVDDHRRGRRRARSSVGRRPSNETGIFDIPLPGTAIDNLGKTSRSRSTRTPSPRAPR